MAMTVENVFTKGKSEWHAIDENKVEYKGDTYYRNTAVKAILCMGVDRKDDMTETIASDGYIGSADGLILVVQDTARNKVKLLMIPRDSIVEMEILDEMDNSLGYQYEHLCRAFVYGDGNTGSCERVVQSTSDLLCGLDISYYFATDIASLSILNDAVGGVEVIVPNDDLIKANPKWEKGKKVVLHGDEAEHFIRYRDSNIDKTSITRMTQHEAYIQGFYNAVLSNKKTNFDIVEELVAMIEDYMISNMHKDSYMKLALDVLQNGVFEEKDIQTLPGTAYAYGIDTEVAVDYDKAIPMLLELFYLKESE